jgi:hypothetical protein
VQLPSFGDSHAILGAPPLRTIASASISLNEVVFGIILVSHPISRKTLQIL